MWLYTVVLRPFLRRLSMDFLFPADREIANEVEKWSRRVLRKFQLQWISPESVLIFLYI